MDYKDRQLELKKECPNVFKIFFDIPKPTFKMKVNRLIRKIFFFDFVCKCSFKLPRKFKNKKIRLFLYSFFNFLKGLYPSNVCHQYWGCQKWGLECDEGWFEIISEFAKDVEEHIKNWPEHRKQKCYAVQIKEKFGTLNIYMRGADSRVQRIIHKYTKLSTKVCERCGAPGKLRERKWIKTLCNKCNNKR